MHQRNGKAKRFVSKCHQTAKTNTGKQHAAGCADGDTKQYRGRTWLKKCADLPHDAKTAGQLCLSIVLPVLRTGMKTENRGWTI